MSKICHWDGGSSTCSITTARQWRRRSQGYSALAWSRWAFEPRKWQEAIGTQAKSLFTHIMKSHSINYYSTDKSCTVTSQELPQRTATCMIIACTLCTFLMVYRDQSLIQTATELEDNTMTTTYHFARCPVCTHWSADFADGSQNNQHQHWHSEALPSLFQPADNRQHRNVS